MRGTFNAASLLPLPKRPREFLKWAIDIFGPIAANRDERAARFIEEAIELAHAEKLSMDILLRIMERVYARPSGPLGREIGQVLVTLECLAENIGLSAEAEAEREFARVKSIPKEEWVRRQNGKAAISIAGRSNEAVEIP